jgi:hypothetical protein
MEKNKMKTLGYQSPKEDSAHTIEKIYSYKKCYMYRALMIIGDFGVNLLTPDDSFRRWTNRVGMSNPKDLPTEQ